MPLLPELSRQLPTLLSRYGDAWVFDSHNMALAVWYCTCADIGADKINLVTFDYHSDTNNPLTHGFQDLRDNARIRHKSVLAHASNGDPASDTDLVADLVALALSIRNDHQICELNNLGKLCKVAIVQPHPAESPDEIAYDHQRGLDSVRLNWRASESEIADELAGLAVQLQPYILDIDLDYFTRPPQLDAPWWDSLISSAVAITVAREPEYYDECCEDNTLGNDEMLQLVIDRIAAVRGD